MYKIDYKWIKLYSIGDIIIYGGKERNLLSEESFKIFKLYNSVESKDLFNGDLFSRIAILNDRFLGLNSSFGELNYILFDCIKKELKSDKKYEYLEKNPNENIKNIWYEFNEKLGVLDANGEVLFEPIFEKKSKYAPEDRIHKSLNNFNILGISLIMKEKNDILYYHFINIKGEISNEYDYVDPIILQENGVYYILVYKSRRKMIFCLNTFLEQEYIKEEESKQKKLFSSKLDISTFTSLRY